MVTYERIRALLILLILVVLVASIIFPRDIADSIGGIFVKFVIIPAILSFLAGSIVEAATGDTLKGWLITIRVGRLKFSLTVFAIAVLVLKFLVFT